MPQQTIEIILFRQLATYLMPSFQMDIFLGSVFFQEIKL